MKKKLLSLALALVMCLGLTVPAFASGRTSVGSGSGTSGGDDVYGSYDLTLEDMVFSVDPIGIVTIQFVGEDVSHTYTVTAYMFDQPVSVSTKDGHDFTDVRGYEWGKAWDADEVFYDFGMELSGAAVFLDVNNDGFGSQSVWSFEYIDESSNICKSPYMVSKSYVDSLIAEGRHKVDTQPFTAAQPATDAPSTDTPAKPAFTDVADNSPYKDAIAWAVEQNITKGTSATTFGPTTLCTHNHILTFLWRANGSPASEGENDFAKAIAWAKSKGLGDAIDGSAACTRAQTMVYLWKLAGSPKTEASSAFTDVAADADYAQAVAWAVAQGVTKGTSATTFGPDNTCTRGQIVTFLYRNLAE